VFHLDLHAFPTRRSSDLVEKLSPIGDIDNVRHVVEEHIDNDQGVLDGIFYFNNERFWECHEAFEGVWNQCYGREKELVQGIILVAVAFAHEQENEESIGIGMLSRALDKLGTSPSMYHSIDVDKIRKNTIEDDYQILEIHYKHYGKEIPDFKFVKCEILNHLADDYFLNDENGQVEKLTEEIKTKNESATVIDTLEKITLNAKTEHVKNAAAEVLNAFKDFKELDCCDEHSKTKPDNHEKKTADVFLELDIETDGDNKSEKEFPFDESVTLEAIQTLIKTTVGDEMRKRSGRLD